jgi:hypothetical protein
MWTGTEIACGGSGTSDTTAAFEAAGEASAALAEARRRARHSCEAVLENR